MVISRRAKCAARSTQAENSMSLKARNPLWMPTRTTLSKGTSRVLCRFRLSRNERWALNNLDKLNRWPRFSQGACWSSRTWKLSWSR
jgi:hypothetical protein